MKNWIVIGLVVVALGVWWWGGGRTGRDLLSPSGEPVVQEKPYDKYSFATLAERGGQASQIELGRQIGQGEGYVAKMFYYQSEGRRISGQLNLPVGRNTVGVVVMARGYVEKEEYQTGVGTRNAAAVYAKNGYLTLAPDFSGYGESDPEDENALGARLVKPVEILDLLASIGVGNNQSLGISDMTPILLWGHSNGGQIMLSVAEILGRREEQRTEDHLQGDSLKVKGVTLWAPVSKPFPYNILYYTDDPPSPLATDGQEPGGDQGKALRKILAEFEVDYDVFGYSIDRYLDWIEVPLLIHQGSADESVPQKWSDELVRVLREKDKVVTYHTYPGADHNMRPASPAGGPVWGTVVTRDLAWFR